MGGTGLVALCRVDEVDEEVPVRVERDGTEYAVFTRDGACYVTQDVCTHGPGLLSERLHRG